MITNEDMNKYIGKRVSLNLRNAKNIWLSGYLAKTANDKYEIERSSIVPFMASDIVHIREVK